MSEPHCERHKFGALDCVDCAWEEAKSLRTQLAEAQARAAEWEQAARDLLDANAKLEAERDEARAELAAMAQKAASKSLDGYRELAERAEQAERLMVTANNAYLAERQTRERAEADVHRERVRAAYAESQAATLRAALERERAAYLEFASNPGEVPAHIEAALSSDAGAGLLAFARAAYRELSQYSDCSPNDDWADGILALAPEWLKGGQ